MHKGDVRLKRDGRSARLTEGGYLRETYHAGEERHIAGKRQHMRRKDRGDHMYAGRGAHPGADARAMHPGIVVRGMVKLMRDRAACRDCQ